MFQPMHGMRNISALDTHLKCRKSRKRTRMSRNDWWFATMTYVRSGRMCSRPSTRTLHSGFSHE
jgi:hypothetical protein